MTSGIQFRSRDTEADPRLGPEGEGIEVWSLTRQILQRHLPDVSALKVLCVDPKWFRNPLISFVRINLRTPFEKTS